MAASPAGLGRTADAQLLGRQGFGSVGARMAAVPIRELTLSTLNGHLRSKLVAAEAVGRIVLGLSSRGPAAEGIHVVDPVREVP